ncbi:MAG: Gfo/Idh/MocA family oxidoreductase [Armatimonadetes bacterium]|nr:Gfo/Idh/MocA family oxidoreductase [Armatimonadota bacterium]
MQVGFIGAGGIASNYRSSLRKLGVRVAAVCDTNAERAKQVAEEEGGTAYTDHRALLAAAAVDAVFICIPPGAHERQVADCAAAGRALFVAKPIGLSLDTVRESLAAIRASAVLNQVGYMARYSDLTAKTKELLDGRTVGMALGRFMCRMGANHPWWGKFAVSGGQMLEQSTHMFDILRYHLGEVTAVQANGHQGLADDVADFAQCTVCNLQFESGAVGTISSTCAASVPDGFAAELVGRDCYLKLVFDHRLRGVIGGQAVEFDGEESGYYRQVEQFVAALGGGGQALVRSSYEDAARTLAVTLAANRSLASGRVETVEEV